MIGSAIVVMRAVPAVSTVQFSWEQLATVLGLLAIGTLITVGIVALCMWLLERLHTRIKP